MSKKCLFLFLVLGLCLTPQVQAQNIIWVSGDHDDNGDGEPDDIGWIEFLRDSGYTVAFEPGGPWEDLDDTEIAALNDADLVIVSRDSNSGAYDDSDDEIATWNGITSPLILMNVYIARNSRWLWIDGTSLKADAGTPLVTAVDVHHPIFSGVTMDADFNVDIWDQTVGSGTVSMYAGIELGNGTLIAKEDGEDVTVIAEWEPGVEYYAGAGQTPADRRMLFCAGTREGNGQGRGEFDLNDEGKILFTNMIDYMLGDLVREPWVKAWQPEPADGATGVVTPLLRWTPGDTAVFHDVYVGDTAELTADDLALPRSPMTLHFVQGLEPGTTYYWRVDEVELDGTTHEGDVWSFTVAPLIAYSPEPKDGAKWIEPAGAVLEWMPGQGAGTHDVYFGTDETAVADGTGDTFQGNLFINSLEVGDLEAGTTYYWRVDELMPDGTVRPGDVWSFTTQGEGGGIRGYYYANASLNGVPVLNQIDPQINFNWGGETPSPMLPNDNFSVRWVGEVDVPFSETYTFYANTEDGVRLWVNDIQIMDFWQNRRSPTEARATIDLVGGQRYPIVMEFYDAGGDAVAELRWESASTPKELIPQGAFSPPVKASSPSPGVGAVNVTQQPTLTWGAGEKAAQHDVYFGDDADAVAGATPATAGIYRGQQQLDNTSYDPGVLEWNKTYYWRIDEVNAADADSPWTGNVWNFTTADFIVVDDFESYTNNSPNRVFQTWVDGIGFSEDEFYPGGNPGNGTGALVGHDIWSPDSPHFEGDIIETSIVQDGGKSLPLYYNNGATPHYSEAERTWQMAQDWTVNGVSDLSLWFHGNPVAFLETADGITMSGAGTDIWDTSDEFRFAYKRLGGNGSITARVDSVDNTNGWAKAGVMIRESLDADSRHAYVVVTPSNGVSFGHRSFMGDVSDSATEAGITAPHWVKLTRTGDTLTAQHSADGVTWVDVTDPDGEPTEIDISMIANVYVGLAVTSHNADAVCQVEFSNVSTTGATGQWQVEDIGVAQPGNDPDPLYVAVQDTAGRTAVVMWPDGVLVNEWTHWMIPLTDLSDAGANLAAIKKMFIGMGDRDNPTPAGDGLVYIDTIRVVKPEQAEATEEVTE
jgi:hypothetical protein